MRFSSALRAASTTEVGLVRERRGKRNMIRLCPLWPSTTAALKELVRGRADRASDGKRAPVPVTFRSPTG